ncbi:hypothetical protein FACS1894107_06260 [Planctomycetales bacterium]|nr:hypothetical protein FACS1894107_06260 [Planctomycetales bacterium]
MVFGLTVSDFTVSDRLGRRAVGVADNVAASLVTRDVVARAVVSAAGNAGKKLSNAGKVASFSSGRNTGICPEDLFPWDLVPGDAVPEDAVPKDAVPEDAVPKDADAEAAGIADTGVADAGVADTGVAGSAVAGANAGKSSGGNAVAIDNSFLGAGFTGAIAGLTAGAELPIGMTSVSSGGAASCGAGCLTRQTI